MSSRIDRSDRTRRADPRISRPARFAAATLLAAGGAGALAYLAAGPVRSAAGESLVLLEEIPAIGPNGQPVAGKESTEPVFVRDSAIAKEKMNLAERMERAKEWHKSADVYQEVLEKYHDRVVPDGTDAKGVINRYASVSRKVLAQVSRWPQEGLDVYRGRYEPKAAELVQNARPDDLFSLHKAFDLYFVTESGKQAGLRLIDAHLEKGEYAAAAWIGDQLLDMHPGLLAERPAVLFRTSLAYHLAGQKDKAQERAGQLAAKFPKEMGVLRGKDVTLGEALEQELKQEAGTVVSAVGGGDSWPMPGGGPSRGVVSDANASTGARLASIPLAKPVYANVAPPQQAALRNQLEIQAQSGMTLNVLPSVDRGELYFQDGQRVYAVSLDSGMPLPGWAQTYPDRNGQYVLQSAASPSRTVQQSLTLTDRYVVAVMGQPDRTTQMITGQSVQQGEGRLVCLDRATGREAWPAVSLATAPDVPKNDDEKAIRALQMSGSPLVVGDNVLVIGRSLKPTQGEDCYVLAFDVNSGRFRWGCYVASSGAGPGAMYGIQPTTTENTSHLAYANGRVYVLTNLGALAALDAYSGSIAWLNIYPLDRPDMMGGAGGFRGGFNPMWMRGDGGYGGGSASRLKPWAYNPVVVQNGRLFMLPTEGKHLIVYDAGSGKEVKRINLDQLARWNLKQNSQADRPTTLVGVHNEKLVLAGESRVLCIDWQRYDWEKFPGPDDEMIVWPSVVPGGIRGRCFMTAKSVYVPADDRLRRLDIETGSAVEEYPKHPRKWEDGEGPGNVLVTGDHVVVAGAGSVDVYADLDAARRKLDREIAQAPNDPEARLRYAEVMFVSGQPDAALQRLDEAITQIGGRDKMQPGPSRDRVFNDALTFAQKTAAEDRPNAASTARKVERVAALYDRAAAAAAGPQQNVRWRMSRAKFAEAQKDPAAAVKLYQEVLSDAAMRTVSLLDEQAGNPTQAEEVAERSIDQLIKSAGPGVYAPYQEQAAKALDEAKADADPVGRATKLLAVAQAYPNAGSAADAMLAAADAYEQANQPRPAARVLRQMWFKYPQGANRAAVLEGIARNYLSVRDRNRAEMVSTAAARLAQGTQLPGDPKLTKALKLPDGKVVAEAGASFEQALAEVRKVVGQEAGKTLPDFGLPVPQPGQKPYPKPFAGQKKDREIGPDVAVVLPGAMSLVLPNRDFARADRVVTWSPTAGVAFWAAGEAKPLATSKVSFGPAAGGIGGGIRAALGMPPPAAAPPPVVPAPPRQVVEVEPDGGLPGAAAPRPVAPAYQPPPGAPRGVAWAGDTALIWGAGKLAAVEAASGRVQWEIDFPRLQTLEVVRANDGGGNPGVAQFDPNMGNFQQQIIINNRVRRVNARGNVVLQPGGNLVIGQAGAVAMPAQAPPAQPAPPAPGGGEQVAEVRPVGDRVLVTTSTGRLASVDLAGGKIAWQARLSDRLPDRLAATEDFTVVKVSDELNVRLFGLDTYSGRILGSKSYAQNTGTAPVNLALSADGTLVFTQPDRMVLKDLYKNWAAQDEEKVVAGTPGQQPYAGANQPGQLVVAEGRILAVADSGGGQMGVPPNQKYVRIHSLETGQPLQMKYDAPGEGGGGKRQIDRILTAGTKDWNVVLRTVGPRLYVTGPQTVYGYNLDNPADTWEGNTKTLYDRPQNDVNFRDAFVGQTHVVVLDEPVSNNEAAPKYYLHAYGRYQPKEPDAQGESGRRDYVVAVTDPSGVLPQWQACDGGLYYATGDGKVHLLAGARPQAAAQAK